ncbi:LacI family DNA-binding transcriptional regulator [Gordonia sp. NPDC003424]
MSPSNPSPQTPATLQDVAMLAGVSVKTVARAINGEAHVRPETRQQVIDAAAKLRFRPNRVARELRQGARTQAVALVIGTLDNPFYAGVGAGLERNLRARQTELFLASADDDPDREEALTRGLLERRVKGLVVVPVARDHKYLEIERQLGMPIVFVDRPSMTIAADSVVRDNHGGAASAVREFISNGHRRIAVIADNPEVFTASERLRGYEDEMRDGNLDIDPNLVRTGVQDTDAAQHAAEELLALPEPPTAILALNNRISIGVLNMLLSSNDSTTAFIGFDDFDLAPALGISVITNDPVEMGEKAAELILESLDGDEHPPRQVTLPATLIRRGSGERAPSALVAGA